MFARLAAAVGEQGASLGATDLVRVVRGTKVRDVTVLAEDAGHIERVVAAVREARPGPRRRASCLRPAGPTSSAATAAARWPTT